MNTFLGWKVLRLVAHDDLALGVLREPHISAPSGFLAPQDITYELAIDLFIDVPVGSPAYPAFDSIPNVLGAAVLTLNYAVRRLKYRGPD